MLSGEIDCWIWSPLSPVDKPTQSLSQISLGREAGVGILATGEAAIYWNETSTYDIRSLDAESSAFFSDTITSSSTGFCAVDHRTSQAFCWYFYRDVD